MSGNGDAVKSGDQGGILDSVKQAGDSVTKAVTQKTGGSQASLARKFAEMLVDMSSDVLSDSICEQVGDVVQEKESGGAKKVAKE